MQTPVKQWGLLSWNKRWLTFDGRVISLYKGDEGVAGQAPIVQFDLSQQGVSASALRLDPSLAPSFNATAATRNFRTYPRVRVSYG